MLPISDITSPFGMPFDWRQWFARADETVEAQRLVGTTANRPDWRKAWPGMQYFDSDLGKPVWASVVTSAGVTWVDATGASV